MAEYIDKEAACKGMPDDYYGWRDKQILRSIPAADVRENVRGQWTSPDGISTCSNCGKAAPYDVEGDIIMYWPNLNYCPNCGAKMEVQDG